MDHRFGCWFDVGGDVLSSSGVSCCSRTDLDGGMEPRSVLCVGPEATSSLLTQTLIQVLQPRHRVDGTKLHSSVTESSRLSRIIWTNLI